MKEHVRIIITLLHYFVSYGGGNLTIMMQVIVIMTIIRTKMEEETLQLINNS